RFNRTLKAETLREIPATYAACQTTFDQWRPAYNQERPHEAQGMATPRMSQGHLFFSVMTTIYVLMGIAFEEHDLVAELGDRYLDYRRRVRALLPIPRRPQGP